MFILFMVGVAVNVVTMSFAIMSGGNAANAAVISGLIGMILPALFAVLSWRAYVTIPKYLMQPAWCQELIVKANL